LKSNVVVFFEHFGDDFVRLCFAVGAAGGAFAGGAFAGVV
jgi:hypothetical protein